MSFLCESHRKFTVIAYNRTLVSKEIIENIDFSLNSVTNLSWCSSGGMQGIFLLKVNWQICNTYCYFQTALCCIVRQFYKAKEKIDSSLYYVLITFSILNSAWLVFCSSFSWNVPTILLPFRSLITYVHGTVFYAFLIMRTFSDQFEEQSFAKIRAYFGILTRSPTLNLRSFLLCSSSQSM